MTPIDYILLGIVGLSALMALMRGIVAEVMSLVVWALALWCSISFSGALAENFLRGIEPAGVRLGSAYILLFLLVLIVGGMLTWCIRRIIAKTGLSSTDRLLGGLFGASRGLLIVFSAVLFAGFTKIPQQPFWRESAVIPYVGAAARELTPHLPAGLSNYLTFPKASESDEIAHAESAKKLAQQAEAKLSQTQRAEATPAVKLDAKANPNPKPASKPDTIR